MVGTAEDKELAAKAGAIPARAAQFAYDGDVNTPIPVR